MSEQSKIEIENVIHIDLSPLYHNHVHICIKYINDIHLICRSCSYMCYSRFLSTFVDGHGYGHLRPVYVFYNHYFELRYS